MSMNIDIDINPEIQGQSALAPLINSASEQLEEVLRRSAEPVHVQWEMESEKPRQPVFSLEQDGIVFGQESAGVRPKPFVVRLELSDGSERASRSFTESELRDRGHMWVLLYRLWGDVLQARSERQMAALHELVQQLPGD